MKEFPKGGLIGKAVRLLRAVVDMRIPIYASHAGFFIVLSLFPSLVLLMSLVRYTGIGVENLTRMLEGIIPGALMPAAERLLVSTYRRYSGIHFCGDGSVVGQSGNPRTAYRP